MTGLRAAVIGLLGFAAAEEQMLLADSPAGERGGPGCWAAAPLVLRRLYARRSPSTRTYGSTPPGTPTSRSCAAAAGWRPCWPDRPSCALRGRPPPGRPGAPFVAAFPARTSPA